MPAGARRGRQARGKTVVPVDSQDLLDRGPPRSHVGPPGEESSRSGACRSASGPNPRRARASSANSSVEVRRPRKATAAARGAASPSGRGTGCRGASSIPGASLPPADSRIRIAARSSASGDRLGVGPALEAVRRVGVEAEAPRSAADVTAGPTRRLREGRCFVAPVTAVSSPPMIPASDTARSASATTMSEGSNAPLDAVERHELLALAAPCARSRRPPASRSKSKAWRGWPMSHIP